MLFTVLVASTGLISLFLFIFDHYQPNWSQDGLFFFGEVHPKQLNGVSNSLIFF